MQKQTWPLTDFIFRLPKILGLFFHVVPPASDGKMTAGYFYLSDDALTLAADFRPHPYAFAPLLGVFPILANLILAVALIVAATKLSGKKFALAVALGFFNALLGTVSARLLWPYSVLGANVLSSPKLHFLCFAACLEDQIAAHPHNFELTPPATKRLSIVFVHETASEAKEEAEAGCELFEPHNIERVISNLSAFVCTHLGLASAVKTLDDVLGPEGGDARSAETMTIYVLFLSSTAACERWKQAAATVLTFSDGAAHSYRNHAWPSLQTVVVLPPYEVMERRCPDLLNSLVVFSGKKNFVPEKNTEHAGIASAVLSAISAKVSGVLLERLA